MNVNIHVEMYEFPKIVDIIHVHLLKINGYYFLLNW